MAEPVEDTGPKTRLTLGIIVLVLCVIAIIWCVKWGDPANLLHQNTLSWSFIVGTLVLGGLGFPAAIEAFATMKK